jgi:hypothetical protein
MPSSSPPRTGSGKRRLSPGPLLLFELADDRLDGLLAQAGPCHHRGGWMVPALPWTVTRWPSLSPVVASPWPRRRGCRIRGRPGRRGRPGCRRRRRPRPRGKQRRPGRGGGPGDQDLAGLEAVEVARPVDDADRAGGPAGAGRLPNDRVFGWWAAGHASPDRSWALDLAPLATAGRDWVGRPGGCGGLGCERPRSGSCEGSSEVPVHDPPLRLGVTGFSGRSSRAGPGRGPGPQPPMDAASAARPACHPRSGIGRVPTTCGAAAKTASNGR